MKAEPEADLDFFTDLVLNFLIAGRDTTAQAMSWCLYLVMQHPEVEAQLLEEVTSITGASELTYAHLTELTFTEDVLREALRLYPSVPLDPKLATEDVTLPDGTFAPKGTVIFYNSYGMGRSTRIWGPDAGEFRPQRWGDMVVDPYEYPVFHAGPRECLGRRLAMVEMKMMLASLVKHLKLTLAVRPEEVLPDTAATLGMSTGLKCYVEVRAT